MVVQSATKFPISLAGMIQPFAVLTFAELSKDVFYRISPMMGEYICL
ncbi:hypothetical protein [Calothrix sp. NIES-3974]|nr:hypothetical protein [Calothrix sp. NIES-3974]